MLIRDTFTLFLPLDIMIWDLSSPVQMGPTFHINKIYPWIIQGRDRDAEKQRASSKNATSILSLEHFHAVLSQCDQKYADKWQWLEINSCALLRPPASEASLNLTGNSESLKTVDTFMAHFLCCPFWRQELQLLTVTECPQELRSSEKKQETNYF